MSDVNTQNTQQGIVSYEELRRLNLAKDLIKDESCGLVEQGCHTKEEEKKFLKDKTIKDIGNLPPPRNETCPHPKVIVAVSPIFAVQEKPVEMSVDVAGGKNAIIDYSKCDGRNNFDAIKNAKNIDSGNTVTKVEEVTTDNFYDKPHKATRVTKETVREDAKQPLAVDPTAS